MKPARSCPRCGTPLGDAADGLCLVCAGRLALETSAEETAANAPALGVRLGDYEILDELGRGAMGVVFRARQLSLKRVVALKVVLSGQFASEAERRRFLGEVEFAATLDHPNIVPVYEVGSAEGRLFCAMKLIDGQPLAQRIASGSARVSEREAAALLARAARAVHHAHQRGIIHRDLKPANILVDAAGQPHITDFGLARRVGVESSLSLTGSPLGTPAYMSPEQARGEKTITTAADIWSLGVMLYQLLAGHPPFAAENVPALLRRIVEEEPVPFTIHDSRSTSGVEPGLVQRKSEIATRVDPDLATICLKCLEKDPARRYASAAELADDLERWQRQEPILARRCSAWERALKWCARHPHRAMMIAVLLAVFLAGVGGVTWQWQRAERETVRVRETAAREAAALLRNEAAKDAFLEQARALRASGQPGQRVKALEALAVAARIRPGLELRNEALAALALPDLQPAGPALIFPEGSFNVGFDADVRRGVTGGAAGQLHVFELSGGALLTNWPAPDRLFGWPNFSPDGAWLATRHGTLTVYWNVASGQCSPRFPTRFGMKHHPATEFSPDSRRLALADGRETIALVDVATGDVTGELRAGAAVDAFAFSPDGRHLAVLAGPSLEIIRVEDGEIAARYSVSAGSWVSWQADGGRLFVASSDQMLRVVETETGTVRAFPAPSAPVFHRAALHPRGVLLVTASPGVGGSGLWDAAAGRFLFSFADGAYHFSRDGQRLGCLRRNEGLAVWNVIEADAVRSFPGPTNAVLDFDVSSDGQWLITASEDSVRLWKLAGGQEIDFVPQPGVRTVEFATDGRAVVGHSVSNSVRWLLEMKARRFHREQSFGVAQVGASQNPNHTSFTGPAATNSTTHLAAEIILTRRIRLTDSRTGETVAEVAPPESGEVQRLGFSRDGQRLLAVTDHGLIHVWDLPRLRAELAKLNLDWGSANPGSASGWRK